MPLQFEPLNYIVPRQRKAKAAVNLIGETSEELIAKCKKMVRNLMSDTCAPHLGSNSIRRAGAGQR